MALVVFSLTSVNIPLAAFAFAGGALAIGIGFGTQTLLKKFISGIILLFERPFRIGDVVDVQGKRGTVSSIGIRACVVHLWDGTEELIPNSALLENIVTNWTYSDRLVRFSIKVGVAMARIQGALQTCSPRWPDTMSWCGKNRGLRCSSWILVIMR